jgi:acyl-coenzyme A thioesterase PaaI-like protein
VSSAQPAGSLDPATQARVRDSFGRQTMLATVGAVMTEVEAGRVVLEMPSDARFGQQFRYTHTGAVTTVVDTACGYAR